MTISGHVKACSALSRIKGVAQNHCKVLFDVGCINFLGEPFNERLDFREIKLCNHVNRFCLSDLSCFRVHKLPFCVYEI